MRKILLATTALAGVALFASAAQAGMEVTVGGYNDFRAGFFSNDLTTAPRRSNDFENEFQLEVEAKAKANNGMEYGVVASLWNGYDYTNAPDGSGAPTAGNLDNTGTNSTGFRVHQAYGYVNGAWGQIRTGDEHGASDFGVYAPTSYDFGGQVNGAYSQFLTAQTVFAITPSYVDDTENDTKVSYFTPKFGMNGHKFQAGVSYAPNQHDAGTGVIVSQAAGAGNPQGSNNYKNIVEIGGGYEGQWFDKFSTKLGAVVTTAENVTGRTLGGAAINDFTSWSVGGQVGYAGFAVGGNYTDAGSYNKNVTQTGDQNAWSVGASYKFDRASIAGSYLRGHGFNNSIAAANAIAGDNNDVSYRAWGIGAGYSLFDGMVTSVDAVFYDQDTPTGGANNNDGHVIILSNRISF
jgi:hypothetical protein